MFEAGSRISHTLQNGEANMLPIGGVWWNKQNHKVRKLDENGHRSKFRLIT
jgi:3-methyladenine DNA glycosylase AlkC